MPINLSARNAPVTVFYAIRACKARLARAEASARKRIARVAEERAVLARLTATYAESKARVAAEEARAAYYADPYKDQPAPVVDGTPAPLPAILASR